MNITYEKVTKLPTNLVIELYKAGGWWHEEDSDASVIPQMIKGSFCFMIAKDEVKGKIVGMGRAISDGVSDAYIQDVVVLSEYRGKGIGAGLIRELTNYCLKKNLLWIGLIGEPGTESFYTKLAYETLKDHIPMRYHKT